MAKRRAAGTTKSRKAKGRNFMVAVQKLILEHFPQLTVNDVYKPVGTVPGCDLHLSELGRSVFPFGVEGKCQESLAIWEALEQCETNAAQCSLTPLLFFKRNRTEIYATMRAKDLLKILALSAQGR